MLFLSDFYKNKFGCKVYKIALDAHCTCPNRDGTKGTGGCIFCSQSGSGDFIGTSVFLKSQFEEGVCLVEKKARGRSGKNKALFLPYFQSFTSTYGNFEKLKELYLEALSFKNVCGIAIATRPDCLSFQIIELLKQISQKFFVQIELGLQTSCEQTGKFINRCYTNDDYKNAVSLLKKEIPGAHIVTHLIFGLPGEKKSDMLKSVDFVLDNFTEENFFGIKITNLYVVKNTVLEKMFAEGKFECMEMENYFEILKLAFEKMPEKAVIHRFTGDPPKKIAIAPQWALNKKSVLSYANKILINR